MAQATFLVQFVDEMLKETGLANLTPEQKQIYVPQMTALLEQRIGLKLVPQLDETQMQNLADLADKDASAEAWKTFWYNAIPNFEEQIKNILSEFAAQIIQRIPAA